MYIFFVYILFQNYPIFKQMFSYVVATNIIT